MPGLAYCYGVKFGTLDLICLDLTLICIYLLNKGKVWHITTSRDLEKMCDVVIWVRGIPNYFLWVFVSTRNIHERAFSDPGFLRTDICSNCSNCSNIVRSTRAINIFISWRRYLSREHPQLFPWVVPLSLCFKAFNVYAIRYKFYYFLNELGWRGIEKK